MFVEVTMQQGLPSPMPPLPLEPGDSASPDLDGFIAQMADLRESLHVALLKAQTISLQFADRNYFTREEAAFICNRGVSTIKDAIASGKLKTGSSKWIARTSLEEWLGADPITACIKKVATLPALILDLGEQIRALTDSRPRPADQPTETAA